MPDEPMPERLTVGVAERLARRTDRTGGCWLWTGPLSPAGYGQIGVGGKARYVHRVAYELSIGPIPEGLEVLRSCNDTRCVKPDHLLAGVHPCRRPVVSLAKTKRRAAQGMYCRIEGCARERAPGKRICRMHRSRKARTGSYGPPEAHVRPGPAELLAASSTRSGECLLWTGRVSDGGYGVITIGRQQRYVHRLSYETHVGAIPTGLNVLHSCDTPRCIEPAHLRVGTQADNVQDMVLRQRHTRHLGPDRVAEMYRRFAAGDTVATIGRAMGIPLGTVSARRVQWKRSA